MFGTLGISGFISGGNTGGGGGAGTGVSHVSFTGADFEADGVTYLNALFTQDNISLYWSDLANYIYFDSVTPANGEWKYVPGGIEILIAGFDANVTPTVRFEADLKIVTTT